MPQRNLIVAKTNRPRWFRVTLKAAASSACVLLIFAPASAQETGDEVERLRQQVETLSLLVNRLAGQVQAQAEQIDQLKQGAHAPSQLDDEQIDPQSGDGLAVLSTASGERAMLVELSEPVDGQSQIPVIRPLGRFPDDAIVRAGSFEGALQLPGSDASIKIGGLIRAEASQDLDSLGFQDTVNHRRIPLDGTPEDGNGQSRFHVRNSQVNIDYRRPSSAGEIRAFIEYDFFGGGGEFINNYELRLRHAVVAVGDIYAGQWWSQFTDIPATPETVDFGPPLGQPVLRNPGLRFSRSLGSGDDWRFGLGIENPAGDLTDDNNLFASDSVPNFTGFIETTQAWGRVRLAALGLQLDSETDQVFTGGLNVTGRLNTPWLHENDNLVFGVSGGEGFTHYYSVFAGAGLEGVIDSDGNIEATGVLGGYLGYQHWWNDHIRSTFVASALALDSPDGSDASAFDNGVRYRSNLFWTPIENLDVGLEYTYAHQETVDGREGSGSRLNAVVQIDF